MKQEVEKVVQNAKNYIDDVFQEVKQYPWTDKTYYQEWLAQTFFYVSHTTRMLALAAAKFKTNSENHFHLKFIEHLGEEKGHEKLAEFDLKNLGFKTTDFEELPETSSIYHALYYGIDAVNPITILGYALVLEGLAATKLKPIYELLSKTYGPKACTFLKVHCDVDVGHSKETYEILEKCTPEQLKLINHGIPQAAEIYKGLYRAIMRKLTRDKNQIKTRLSLSA